MYFELGYRSSNMTFSEQEPDRVRISCYSLASLVSDREMYD